MAHKSLGPRGPSQGAKNAPCLTLTILLVAAPATEDHRSARDCASARAPAAHPATGGANRARNSVGDTTGQKFCAKSPGLRVTRHCAPARAALKN